MESITKILSVAIGGAFGAVVRYLINVSPLASVFEHFPLPTFAINVSGSFFIGFLLILLTDRIAVSDNFRMMIIVGFLGAFTTFSTFEMEIYGLLRDDLRLHAVGYMIASIVVGFAGLLFGLWCGKNFPLS